VRDVVLRVNEEYIRSAGTADEYRTEPPFKLQGSYRNMNRIAEKVLPIMNDDELKNLVNDHYASESQTLTTASEANLLKYKELVGSQTKEETARWNEIKSTFNRRQLLGGDGDPMQQIIAVLSTFREGLGAIQNTLVEGIDKMTANPPVVVVEAARPIDLTTPATKQTEASPRHDPPPPREEEKPRSTTARRIIRIDDDDPSKR
jgi:hypothetical protein